MPRLSSLGRYAVVQFLLVIVSCFVLMLAVFALWKLGFGNDPAAVNARKTMLELSIRVALLFLIGSSYLVLFTNRSARAWILGERWPLLLLVLFVLGAVTSMADPYHTIQAEGNWIRYGTAGPLGLAGIVAFFSSFGRGRAVFERLFGVGFGALLFAAGMDEILQFHERLGDYLATLAPARTPIEAQDAVTLGVAALGVVALVLLIVFRRYGGSVAALFWRPHYQRPFYLFAFAVGCFMIAMMFDTFDTYLVDAFDYVRLKTTGTSAATSGGSWLDIVDFGRYANSVEEMLECLAALSLLMMVGTLFSVGFLQCRKWSSTQG